MDIGGADEGKEKDEEEMCLAQLQSSINIIARSQASAIVDKSPVQVQYATKGMERKINSQVIDSNEYVV